jgi:hypothetical protein
MPSSNNRFERSPISFVDGQGASNDRDEVPSFDVTARRSIVSVGVVND